MEYMTARQRMITALRNGQPDRVPVAPDISNMIPCRLTGKPFWEIYVNNSPPLWQAYLDAIRYFGIDGWFIYGELQYQQAVRIEVDTIVERQAAGRRVRRVYHTPAGELTSCQVSPADNPPTMVEKLIKNFKEDFAKIKYLFADITGYDDTEFRRQKQELGEAGIMAIGVGTPGLHFFGEFFHGNLEAATYALTDYPDLFEELRELFGRYCLRQVEMALAAGADSILTGGSGSITMQSPELWRRLSLPTLQEITRRCRAAGVICGVHSCGKECYLVDVCARETELDYINPLEIPPMGDCDLADCKTNYGARLALMGNLHTTDVMLYGSPRRVRRKSLEAILAAGQGGGFVLSTGDQCGRDTPDENIRAMVEAVRQFGHYPLDVVAIRDEIKRLAD
jgi:uroporphyrinogen decarboxylase